MAVKMYNEQSHYYLCRSRLVPFPKYPTKYVTINRNKRINTMFLYSNSVTKALFISRQLRFPAGLRCLYLYSWYWKQLGLRQWPVSLLTLTGTDALSFMKHAR